MNDVAKAIHVVQAATGCRVMLLPMVGEGSATTPDVGILKPSESVSGPVKVTGAAPTRAAQKALKSVSEPASQPAKSVRKSAKPVKDKAATFMTVAKFAELKGVAPTAIYNAVRTGRISADMVNNTSGHILINSRTELPVYDNHHRRDPIKIFCQETKMTFDSIAQAVKGTGLARNTIMHSLNKGITTHKGLTFTRV